MKIYSLSPGYRGKYKPTWRFTHYLLATEANINLQENLLIISWLQRQSGYNTKIELGYLILSWCFRTWMLKGRTQWNRWQTRWYSQPLIRDSWQTRMWNVSSNCTTWEWMHMTTDGRMNWREWGPNCRTGGNRDFRWVRLEKPWAVNTPRCTWCVPWYPLDSGIH